MVGTRVGFGVGEKVGVGATGWKGVGVAVACGSGVTRMTFETGRITAGVGLGDRKLQDERKMAEMNNKSSDRFINGPGCLFSRWSFDDILWKMNPEAVVAAFRGNMKTALHALQ